MDFFGMGPLEVLLILLIGLIIWGPNKIPEIARGIGKTVHTFRKASIELTTAVTRELEEEKKKTEPKTGDQPKSTPGSQDPNEIVGPGASI